MSWLEAIKQRNRRAMKDAEIDARRAKAIRELAKLVKESRKPLPAPSTQSRH